MDIPSIGYKVEYHLEPSSRELNKNKWLFLQINLNKTWPNLMQIDDSNWSVFLSKGFSHIMKGIMQMGLLNAEQVASLHPNGPETTWVRRSDTETLQLSNIIRVNEGGGGRWRQSVDVENYSQIEVIFLLLKLGVSK